MGYYAVQVKLSYEYTKAIPSDNPKFIVYNDFVKKYGVDGTTVVVGFKTDLFYTKDFFNQVDALHKIDQAKYCSGRSHEYSNCLYHHKR